jgi:hypothetical protein
MMTLVVLLEEPSARAMLSAVLPRLLPTGIVTQFVVFEGKQDLDKQLSRRLKFWQVTNSRFVILRDQDSGDCKTIKQSLLARCGEAGKPGCLVRIACHELESFYLGDLAAVEAGLGIKGLARQQGKRKFRQPDDLTNAAEELLKITGQRYQKVGGSRQIAPHLRLDGSNCSRSFTALVTGLRRLCADLPDNPH